MPRGDESVPEVRRMLGEVAELALQEIGTMDVEGLARMKRYLSACIRDPRKIRAVLGMVYMAMIHTFGS